MIPQDSHEKKHVFPTFLRVNSLTRPVIRPDPKGRLFPGGGRFGGVGRFD